MGRGDAYPRVHAVRGSARVRQELRLHWSSLSRLAWTACELTNLLGTEALLMLSELGLPAYRKVTATEP
jgi:hypothetical protein